MLNQITFPQTELAAFCRRNQVRWLSLFGSALRADFWPDSDIDLLVEFEPDAAVGFLTLSQMARELAGLIGRPVDLVPRSGVKSLLRETILREEQVIYAG
ncbi:nucleotidyltransferase [Chloroflexus islandicus]|uniref:Nucleotidyltransferase n=1 Tax=Chloroflexus islandicus TaxID=1707952 RepID=A0A178MEH4_9CHLR|nr:nucleotidyltransferase domain-containing protein [Chloroflexus islandicus]OAN46458.1 nucleotidyltransferase [Chloroflexus islandicus]